MSPFDWLYGADPNRGLGPSYLRVLRADPCAYCGLEGEVLDHVQSRKDGGANGWENLTAACASCNGRKGAKALLGFLGSRATLPPDIAWQRVGRRTSYVLAPRPRRFDLREEVGEQDAAISYLDLQALRSLFPTGLASARSLYLEIVSAIYGYEHVGLGLEVDLACLAEDAGVAALEAEVIVEALVRGGLLAVDPSGHTYLTSSPERLRHLSYLRRSAAGLLPPSEESDF